MLTNELILRPDLEATRELYFSPAQSPQRRTSLATTPITLWPTGYKAGHSPDLCIPWATATLGSLYHLGYNFCLSSNY